MARLARFNIPHQPQHIIQRGNNRSPVFLREKDFLVYQDKLRESSIKHQCEIHAFVQMTNHVHLLATPKTADGISKMMQSLGRYYVQYFNLSHGRTGTLWEGRYRATLIDSEQYLFTCSKYIELNPVRASMASQPEEYLWSSYQANALGKECNLVTPHQLYNSLGENAQKRQAAYRALFEVEMKHKDLDQIRQATNKAWVLGGREFRQQVESITNRRLNPKARGGDRKSLAYQQQINRV